MLVAEENISGTNVNMDATIRRNFRGPFTRSSTNRVLGAPFQANPLVGLCRSQ
jgi:hypothetical protein